MRTLEEQIACKCIHFNGYQNESCRAGVAYSSVTISREQKPLGVNAPCFREGESIQCDKRHFPTDDEVAEIVAKKRESINSTAKAFSAVSNDVKAKGLKKGNGGGGYVKCPCCESGQIAYSVAGYNGHIWGQCSTKGCVSWMQ